MHKNNNNNKRNHYKRYNNNHHRGRELPTKMKEEIHLEFFRKFTLKERIKILIGFNIRNVVRIETQHRTGKIKPMLTTEVTQDLQPKIV